MKSIMFVCTMVVLPLIASAGLMTPSARAQTASLELTVDAIDPVQGKMAIVIFADAESYKSGKGAIASAMIAVEGTTLHASFEGLPAGPCAIKIFHDVNDNGELDTNLMGMPVEPFGFSNGAVVRFGPPGFDKAAFDLHGGANSHVISLNKMGG